MSRDETLRLELGELLWVLIDYLEHTDAPFEVAVNELLTQIREFKGRAGLQATTAEVS